MAHRKTSSTTLSPEALRAAINRRYGDGTVRFANDEKFQISRLPTGVLSMDFLLDGGVARGRHTEFYGPQHVGKTYMTLQLIATTQKAGGRCAFVDVEKTFDKRFARHIGVDTADLELIIHRHGNQVVDLMQILLASQHYDVVVCDSIAALLPMSELESDMEAASYGTQQAKLMSGALRRLTTVNDQTAIIWINQIRENIGAGMFGKKTRTSGGLAMGHYAGARIEMVRIKTLKRPEEKVDHATGGIKKTETPYGHRVLARLEKDKTGARPLTETTMVFDYDRVGHDPTEDLIYVGQCLDLVRRNASGKMWVVGYEDQSKPNRPTFKRWLEKSKGISVDLEEQLREIIGELA